MGEAMRRRGLIERFRGRRSVAPRTVRPTGTVTFVLSDIEGSTRLWENEPEAMERAIGRHGAIVGEAIERHGGTLVRERGEGDSTFSVFAHAPAAVRAALDLQRALVGERWEPGVELRVRVALHTGDAYLIDDEDYASPVINRCARIREVAYGGQVLVSEHTAAIVEGELPDDASMRDLGPHRLRDLSKPVRIFQLHHPDLPEDFPKLRSLEAGLHNLPVQLTNFIGREKEVGEVRKHLAATRVLNLTGPGGIGKTRLALQVAGDLVDAYPDGIWFVDLSPVTDADELPRALATALSLRDESNRSVTDSVIDHLRGANALITIDNCEHLIDAASAFATTLLRSCVELNILATGREPLRVPGATTWRVPAMAVPDERVPTEALGTYESIRLFTERAGSVRPDFALTHETGPIVARICQKLDGMPLAIELAAANVASMSVRDIDARLDDRFRTLTRGGPDTPRHETLLATVDWSHDLLTERERVLFRRLSVFAGGFTLEGAEEVCSDEPLDRSETAYVLANLVDKSLIVLDDVLNTTRYDMLETIHDYAALKLDESGEADSTKESHATYFVSFGARASDGLEGPDEVEMLDAVGAELPNLRRAIRRCFASRPAEGLALATSLRQFWSTRGFISEGIDVINEGLSLVGDHDALLRGRALAAAGDLARQLGDLATSRTQLEESLDLQRTRGDAGGLSLTLTGLGNVMHASGDPERAEMLYVEALELARSANAGRSTAAALIGLAIVALSSGDPVRAIPLCEEACAIFRHLETRRLLAFALMNLGTAKMATGDPESARAVLEESAQLAREVGDERLTGIALSTLGNVAVHLGDLSEARRIHEQTLDLSQRLRDPIGIGFSFYRLGETARLDGRLGDATASLESALAVWNEMGYRVGVASCLLGLGHVARLDHRLDVSRDRLREAADIFTSLGNRDGLTYCIENLAGTALDAGDAGNAAKLLAAASATRAHLSCPADPAEQAEIDRDVTKAGAQLGEATFNMRWSEGAAMSLDDAAALARDL
jgi:predicted ATPase/class 3 adenylate cyclase